MVNPPEYEERGIVCPIVKWTGQFGFVKRDCVHGCEVFITRKGFRHKDQADTLRVGDWVTLNVTSRIRHDGMPSAVGAAIRIYKEVQQSQSAA